MNIFARDDVEKWEIPNEMCYIKVSIQNDKVSAKTFHSVGLWSLVVDPNKHYAMQPVKIKIKTRKVANRILKPSLRLCVAQHMGFRNPSQEKIHAMTRLTHEVNKQSVKKNILTLNPISLEEMDVEKIQPQSAPILTYVNVTWVKNLEVPKVFHGNEGAFMVGPGIICAPPLKDGDDPDIYEADLPPDAPLVFGREYNYFLYDEETKESGLKFVCMNDDKSEIIDSNNSGTSIDKIFTFELYGIPFNRCLTPEIKGVDYNSLPDWAKVSPKIEREVSSTGLNVPPQPQMSLMPYDRFMTQPSIGLSGPAATMMGLAQHMYSPYTQGSPMMYPGRTGLMPGYEMPPVGITNPDPNSTQFRNGPTITEISDSKSKKQ